MLLSYRPRDMVGAILNTVLVDLGEMGDYVLTIETKLTACDEVDGHFFSSGSRILQQS